MLPAVIAGGATILGAHLNSLQHDAAASRAARANRENAQMQKEFAQHGIRWKVEDARQAGINPLVALGAQTHSYSPSTMDAGPDNSMGNALSSMGQDVSRAMMAKATPEERSLQTFQIASAKLDLEGKAIDNQIRAAQLKKMTGPSMPPPLPSAMGTMPGQGNGSVNVKPAELIASDTGDLAKEAGILNDYTLARTSTGGFVPVPSANMKERIEDSLALELPWAARHFVTGDRHPTIPEGYEWNPVTLQYEKGYHDTFMGRPFKNYHRDWLKWQRSRDRKSSLRLFR